MRTPFALPLAAPFLLPVITTAFSPNVFPHSQAASGLFMSSSSSADDRKWTPVRTRFATGSELKKLRAELYTFRESFAWAQALNDQVRMDELCEAMEKAEARDPDIVYAKLSREWDSLAKTNETQDDSLLDKLQYVRSFLPQFSLEGLWLGDYGTYGTQLVNITYVGNKLTATKTTGDINIPRGEVTFTVDLSPSSDNTTQILADAQSSSFPGKGQIAKPGFVGVKQVPGTLVLQNHHVVFEWNRGITAGRYRVTFRRPTPEQTLSHLRNVLSQEDELQNMRDHVARCWTMDRTESLARHCAGQAMSEPFRRIASLRDLQKIEQEQKQLQANPQQSRVVWSKFWKQCLHRVFGSVS